MPKRSAKLDDVSEEIREEPWSLYWSEDKSDSANFENFIRNPIPELKEHIPEIDDSWEVVTTLANHERGFMVDAYCRTSMVIPEKKLVINTVYKH
jgi:hypothetical protein